MKLYGTTTSPYVRRVRIVADEVGQPIELINTAPDAGQAKLREVSPIRKVPAAAIDGRTIYDSHVIIDWLVTTRGWHDLAPPRDPWRSANILNAIDSALDSIVQLFYLRRDGVAIDGTPFATRQLERTEAIFAWLAPQLTKNHTFEGAFGLPEIALITTLDWMEFRDQYPKERMTAFDALRAVFRERASLAATRPHA
jgi:glutathione S-transferase